MTPSFSDILDMPASEVERPKPLPQGTYSTVVQGLPRYDKSTKKQTPYVEFTLAINGAADDVNQEALEEMGGFQGKTLRSTYYLTEDSVWRLKDFLINCGLEADGGKSLRALIDETPGRSVGAVIKHKPSDDGTSIYAEVARTVAID